MAWRLCLDLRDVNQLKSNARHQHSKAATAADADGAPSGRKVTSIVGEALLSFLSSSKMLFIFILWNNVHCDTRSTLVLKCQKMQKLGIWHRFLTNLTLDFNIGGVYKIKTKSIASEIFFY